MWPFFSYSSYNLSGLKVNMLFHFLCLSYSRHIIASPFHIFLVLELDGGRKQIWQVDRCSPYKEAQRVLVLLGKFNNHFPPAWENHLSSCDSFGLISTLRNQLTLKVKAAFSGVLISVYLDGRLVGPFPRLWGLISGIEKARYQVDQTGGWWIWSGLRGGVQ